MPLLLLLITLLENCFKLGVMSATGSCWIKVAIVALDQTLEIEVKNSKLGRNAFSNNGIGLQNLRNQLKLIYQERHKISVIEKEHEFITNIIADTRSDKIHADQMSGNR